MLNMVHDDTNRMLITGCCWGGRGVGQPQRQTFLWGGAQHNESDYIIVQATDPAPATLDVYMLYGSSQRSTPYSVTLIVLQYGSYHFFFYYMAYYTTVFIIL